MTDLSTLRTAGKPAIARVLARLESNPDDPEIVALLNAAYVAPMAQVIGLTGPPGVGKSTLAGALIGAYRRAQKTIAVIAIDPSSKRSGGALLGDRTRLRTDPDDQGVFVRSMAARDQLGGLAEITFAAMVLLRALYDVVLIETVGVGQSETDIALAADTIVFCVQPGSGDSLQFMKAGIVEIPDIVVVTKGDLGRAATRARADVKGALGLNEGRQDATAWSVPVLIVSANAAEGISNLTSAVADHAAWLAAGGRGGAKRQAQGVAWVEAAVKERWGREGLKRLSGALVTARTAQSPFLALAEIARQL
ncbi:ArgK/MeaB family GTPase [Dongia rigui]|uniref:GTP-binding protein n=1 Tax=Dongia rigui TaxID=940149 RepID=A0ABU5DZL0_9PROT|nr:GTP-binding protein [Dongia rigui]MDY0872725.1 GTP-binding protein [Dongia rigui]